MSTRSWLAEAVEQELEIFGGCKGPPPCPTAFSMFVIDSMRVEMAEGEGYRPGPVAEMLVRMWENTDDDVQAEYVSFAEEERKALCEKFPIELNNPHSENPTRARSHDALRIVTWRVTEFQNIADKGQDGVGVVVNLKEVTIHQFQQKKKREEEEAAASGSAATMAAD